MSAQDKNSFVTLETIKNQTVGIQQILADLVNQKLIEKQIDINKFLRLQNEIKNMEDNINFIIEQEVQKEEESRGFEKIISGEWPNQDEGGVPSTHFDN